jgi:uncharacterized protein YdeI (YjbR/CyaY-like superfamily)
MPVLNEKTDLYISRSENFAKPVLIHLRSVIHKVCPEVVETIKWGVPYFEYHGNLCMFAAFREHCVFGFWKATALSDPDKIFHEMPDAAMGHLGRLTSLNDLPADEVLEKYIKEAMYLNESGVKVPRNKHEKKELEVPAEFDEALDRNHTARKVFDSFSIGNKRDYAEWIADAKTAETRMRRIETAVEWIAEGKVKNWKYIK